MSMNLKKRIWYDILIMEFAYKSQIEFENGDKKHLCNVEWIKE